MAVDPISGGLLCGGALVAGLVTGGTTGYYQEEAKIIKEQRSRTEEHYKARLARQEDALERYRIRAKNQQIDDIEVSDAQLDDPLLLLRDLSANPASEIRLRKRVKPSIEAVLAKQNPSQEELDRWLMWAVRLSADEEFLGFIEKLQEKGANIDCSDANDEHPLGLAIYWCLRSTVVTLTRLGVDLELDTREITPLKRAEETKHALEQLQPNKTDTASTQLQNSIFILNFIKEKLDAQNH